MGNLLDTGPVIVENDFKEYIFFIAIFSPWREIENP